MAPRANVTVRPAEPGDALAVAELLLPFEPAVPSVLPASRGRGRRAEHPLTLDLAAEHVAVRIADPELIVLVAAAGVEPAGPSDRPDRPDRPEAGDAVVGVVVARFEDAGLLAPTRVLAVGRLAVVPKLRRRGVGRALLTGCIETAEAAGVQYLQSVSHPSARDANRYLARVGFAAMATRRMAPVPTVRRALGLPALGLVAGQNARLARRPRPGASADLVARRLAR